MAETDPIEFDAVFEELGEFGPYQIFVVVLLALAGCVMNGWNSYGMIFMLHEPEHRCKLFENETDSTWNVTELNNGSHTSYAESCLIRIVDSITNDSVAT